MLYLVFNLQNGYNPLENFQEFPVEFTITRLRFAIVMIHTNLPIPGVQGWRSGESTRLPPMWPRFDSSTRRHMWVEFVGSLLCTERFSPGTPVSPLLKNQHLNCCVNC